MRKGTLLILLGALGFVAIVFVLLTRSEPVRVVESRLVRNGAEVSVEGRLRNTGSDAGPLDLEVRYYAVNGDALGEDVLKIKPLRAGSEEAFHTPSHNLAAVSSYSIYLNHGRNPYGN